MQKLTLKLPELFPNGLPIMLPGQQNEIILNKEQVASVLSGGFLGVFSRCVSPGEMTGKKFPDFEFQTFQTCNMIPQMECLLHYFDRISDNCMFFYYIFLFLFLFYFIIKFYFIFS